MLPSEKPGSAPLYQTDLQSTPLPEILVTIHRYKAPGMIECQRGAEVKTIYLDQGQIIFATSNQIRDSLGDKLLLEGKITADQYAESVRRLTMTGQRQGTILTEMDVLEPSDLFLALREQINEIVWSVFAWDTGTVTFTPGMQKTREFVKLHIPVPEAIFQGVRRMPDPRALVARLGAKTTLLERTGHVLEGVTIGEEEQRLLELADGNRSLFELVNSPPLPAPDNARILYALFALQLVAVKEPRPIKVQVKTDGAKYSPR